MLDQVEGEEEALLSGIHLPNYRVYWGWIAILNETVVPQTDDRLAGRVLKELMRWDAGDCVGCSLVVLH